MIDHSSNWLALQVQDLESPIPREKPVAAADV